MACDSKRPEDLTAAERLFHPGVLLAQLNLRDQNQLPFARLRQRACTHGGEKHARQKIKVNFPREQGKTTSR